MNEFKTKFPEIESKFQKIIKFYESCNIRKFTDFALSGQSINFDELTLTLNEANICSDYINLNYVLKLLIPLTIQTLLKNKHLILMYASDVYLKYCQLSIEINNFVLTASNNLRLRLTNNPINIDEFCVSSYQQIIGIGEKEINMMMEHKRSHFVTSINRLLRFDVTKTIGLLNKLNLYIRIYDEKCRQINISAFYETIEIATNRKKSIANVTDCEDLCRYICKYI
jgi:hypothetical protein